MVVLQNQRKLVALALKVEVEVEEEPSKALLVVQVAMVW
jgi:hypothetical protein